MTSMLRPSRVALALALLPATARSTVAQTPITDMTARTIVARAIARRSATLATIRQYRYQAFVKIAARDEAEPAESTRSVLVLAEVHSSAYWEHHGLYQETIDARHRSHDGGFGRQLVSVDEIVHLRRNRVELVAGVDPARSIGAAGRPASRSSQSDVIRYSIVSPIAIDALDHYDYVVQDTVVVAGRRVLRLAVRPTSQTTPLFAGTLDIADSSWDIVEMDLGVNDAIQFPTVSGLRYEQRWADVADGRAMPTEIRLSGTLHPKVSARWIPRTVAGVHLPEFPRLVSFEQVAVLTGFDFDEGERPAGVPEYRVVLSDRADTPDSATWLAPTAVPLDPVERTVWARGDSEDRHPAFIPRVSRSLDAAGRLWLGPGSFHFNRVDGFYLGTYHDWHATSGLVFTTKLGYGWGSHVWQYRVGGSLLVSAVRRVSFGAYYHDETVGWPALAPGSYDPSASALVQHVDPNDYYRERGLTVLAGTKLIDFTRLALRYDDVWQSTQDTIPGLGFRTARFPPLPNPPIRDGRMRSLSGTLTFDSRQMVQSRGLEYRLTGTSWTRVSLGVEVSAPRLIASDFEFQRYAFQIEHRLPLLGLGSTSITVAGGVASHGAPPQRYFTVGYGIRLLAAEGTGFNTLRRTAFVGNRALLVSLRHDFPRQLFRDSGLPLLRGIPATLSLHAGVFWAELDGNTPTAADTLLQTTRKPYREAGFTLGNLTPFLSPFDLAVSCTWQLSSYPTNRFRFGLGINGP
jgi:uncharacterized protein DUF5686